MPKVFVAGALVPTGGAYMAYHIGRLLHLNFGYELIDVHIHPVESTIFHYDTAVKTITVSELEKTATKDDVLVVNPSYSQFLFGLTLPGRKIMYVQDFRTFLLLDCHFDLYVSVSDLVRRYVKTLYDIDTPIIPAFISPPPLEVVPWERRPEKSALVYMKKSSREHQILLRYLENHLSKKGIRLDRVIEGRGMTQKKFLSEVAGVRYFVNLSLAEGFGLVPIEAMHAGTMVTGVNGLAGVDYMKQGENSYTGSIKNLRELPAIIERAFTDEALAQQCVKGGFETAKQFSYDAFKQAWLVRLGKFLGVKAVGA